MVPNAVIKSERFIDVNLRAPENGNAWAVIRCEVSSIQIENSVAVSISSNPTTVLGGIYKSVFVRQGLYSALARKHVRGEEKTSKKGLDGMRELHREEGLFGSD